MDSIWCALVEYCKTQAGRLESLLAAIARGPILVHSNSRLKFMGRRSPSLYSANWSTGATNADLESCVECQSY